MHWILFAATTATVAKAGPTCWHGEFSEQRCCVQKDPDCWDAVYTEKRCCPEAGGGARGDPRCWVDGYSYEDCCRESPKLGCWDAEFGPERCCRTLSEDELQAPRTIFDQDFAEAYVAATADATSTSLGCTDDPPGFWQQVKLASAEINVSRVYGMPGEKPQDKLLDIMTRRVLLWVRNRSAWQADSQACPIGAMNTIDLMAAHVDREIGEHEARQAYRLHEEFLRQLPTSSTFIDLTTPGWRILRNGFEFAPKMLGLTHRHQCHGSKLRIFMYRIQALSHMTSPVLTCSQKMSQCTASVHIHRWLEQGACITEDPEEADLFYLPAYEACYNETACGFGNDTERCFPNDFDPQRHLPYFGRHRGADHVFAFGCNLLPFRDSLMTKMRHSIMVTVESYQAENVAGPNMLAWLSHWKDVLVPGYLPPWRISAMLAFNQPMIQRKLLVTFHGHTSKSTKVGFMYQRSPLAEIRDRLVNYFFNQSQCSVGPPVRDYFRRMGTSKFCLVPAGLTAWTIHLYEAFFFGCVPVILSDEVTVPFQDKIDWPSLSLHVPTNISMEDLHDKLAAFSLARLKVMYRNLQQARCWFDYGAGWEINAHSSGDRECSPYLGIVDALEVRSRRGKELYGLPAFWFFCDGVARAFNANFKSTTPARSIR